MATNGVMPTGRRRSAATIIRSTVLCGLVAAALTASCGAPEPVDEAALALTVTPHFGNGTLPPGALCSDASECASGECRGRCCISTCCGNCNDTSTCDDTGACFIVSAPDFCNCPMCGKVLASNPGGTIFGTCVGCNAKCECPTISEQQGKPCGSFQSGVCQAGECVTFPAANGAPCLYDAACHSFYCVNGICCDSDCTSACQACTVAQGAVTNGTCTALTGTPCNDGNLCTAGDQCVGGACTGMPVTCPSDACNDATCAPLKGCAKVPVADGAPCPGGACMSGVCSPAPDAGSGVPDAGSAGLDAGGTGSGGMGSGETGLGGSGIGGMGLGGFGSGGATITTTISSTGTTTTTDSGTTSTTGSITTSTTTTTGSTTTTPSNTTSTTNTSAGAGGAPGGDGSGGGIVAGGGCTVGARPGKPSGWMVIALALTMAMRRRSSSHGRKADAERGSASP